MPKRMKFLDAKNRLFGKLHIGFIVGVVAVAFFIYLVVTLVNTKPNYVVVRIKGSPGNWWWVTPRPPDWLAAAVKTGDKEYNSLNQPVAEVLIANIYDAGGSTKDVYLTVKLAVRKNNNTNKYRYKGEPLEIGGPITLNLNNTFFPGIVTGIEPLDAMVQPELIPVDVLVRVPNKWPWELDALAIGDTMTDGAGTIIAEVMEKRAYPAEREIANAAGQIVRALSPIKNDYKIRLRLNVRAVGKELVFREEQYLKVGNGLWLQFPLYNISGVHGGNPDGAAIEKVERVAQEK